MNTEAEIPGFSTGVPEMAEATAASFTQLVQAEDRQTLIPSRDSIGMTELERLVAEKMQGQERVIRDTLSSSTMWDIFYPNTQQTPDNLEAAVAERLRAVHAELIQEVKVLLQKKQGYVFLKLLRGAAVHKYVLHFFVVALLSAVCIPLLIASIFAPSTSLLLLGLFGLPLDICLFVWMYVRAKRKQ